MRKTNTIKKAVIVALLMASTVLQAQVSTLAGGSSGYVDATGSAAKFNNPEEMAIDANGNVYVADKYNHRIRKITPAGVVSTFVGTGTASGFGSAGGFADGAGLTVAQFNRPTGMAIDGGNLYVADQGNQRIRKIVIATRVVSTVAGVSGFGNFGDLVDGAGLTVAKFNKPTGIAIDGGNLYVADLDNHRIRKVVLATGVVSTLAGSGTTGFAGGGFADGAGTAVAKFKKPIGIVADGSGNLYVADQGNNRIRKIVLATGVVSTVAGTSTLNPNGGFADGAGLTVARFALPSGITIDGGNLYVADKNNQRIRKIVIATGVVSTVAGSGMMGSNNGPIASATFFRPRSILVNNNTFYLSDEDDKVRKIVLCPIIAAPTAVAQTFCGAKTVADLIANAGTGNTAEWYLSATGGTVLSSTSALITTTYYVVAKNAAGCLSATRTAVAITAYGTAYVAASPQTFCGSASPTIAALTVTINPANTEVWYAALTGGSALASTFALSTSNYYLSAINTATGCENATRIPVVITVNTVDTSVTQAGTDLIANLSGATYQWLDCDNNYGVISGATSKTYNTTATGKYAVGVTLNNCTDTSSCYNVTHTVGVEDQTLLNKLSVYPNPTTGNVMLNLGNGAGDVNIIITDITGKTIVAAQTINNHIVSIDLNHLNKGVYFLQLRKGNEMSVQKIIKQ